MTADALQRKLAALLSADVAGDSRVMAQDEVATLKTLNAHRDAMGGLIRQHGGRVVDAVGDNLLGSSGGERVARQLAEPLATVLRC